MSVDEPILCIFLVAFGTTALRKRVIKKTQFLFRQSEIPKEKTSLPLVTGTEGQPMIIERTHGSFDKIHLLPTHQDNWLHATENYIGVFFSHNKGNTLRDGECLLGGKCICGLPF